MYVIPNIYENKMALCQAIKEGIFLWVMFMSSILKTLIFFLNLPRVHREVSELHCGSNKIDCTVFQYCNLF